MPKPVPRILTVVRSELITANMKRITLTGDDLSSFPEDQDSAYVKLMFTKKGAPEVNFNPLSMMMKSTRPVMRTYTIRRFDSTARELDIDFVIHGDNGPASKWAMNAVKGDQITIAGPGSKKLVDFSADWFFLVGDMTALPAISVNLESLPAHAKGYLVMEIIDEADKQELEMPEGIEARWVINPHPNQQNSLLADKVKSLPFLDGRPSIWTACEFSSMRALRKYFKQEMQVDRSDIYISSYWKMGVSEDEHKIVKKTDSKTEQ